MKLLRRFNREASDAGTAPRELYSCRSFPTLTNPLLCMRLANRNHAGLVKWGKTMGTSWPSRLYSTYLKHILQRDVIDGSRPHYEVNIGDSFG